jgi:hypothetical protein
MGRKLGGNMQMDMNYITVPVFGGENKRLYMETKFSYLVSDQNNPKNHPIYVVYEGNMMKHLYFHSFPQSLL